MHKSLKRLFFGFEVITPWPDHWPVGRLLEEGHRHMTIAFLGNVEHEKLIDALPAFPKPSFKVGLTGQFNQCLFLPEKHPHVVAWQIDWLGEDNVIQAYQKQFLGWLKGLGFHFREREEFLPHVTLCRSPFTSKHWKKAFEKLPLLMGGLHLYESIGNLKYEPLWSFPLIAPFEEFEHTADIAYRIHGENLTQLCKNAAVALAFRFPPLLDYFSQEEALSDIDDVVILLNNIVTLADAERGCPFKAVSFHGELKEGLEHLSWEMIVDV